MSDIARYYDASANPDGRVFHGVPLADLSQPTWESLPKWLRESVDASGMYKKSKPSGKVESKSAPRAVRPAPKKKTAARKPAPAAPVAEPAPSEQAAPVESES